MAMLSAYGFDYHSPEQINNFLSVRKSRKKIGSSYHNLFIVVSQGSI